MSEVGKYSFLFGTNIDVFLLLTNPSNVSSLEKLIVTNASVKTLNFVISIKDPLIVEEQVKSNSH